MTFDDLEFKAHPADPGGVQAVHHFPNGYGVSVIRFYGSYGYEDGLYEIAVLHGTPSSWSLDYSTPIADDVIGSQLPEDVTAILAQVEALPPKSEAA